MGKAHNPRRGSVQFWPRKRARMNIARVRSWANETKAKPLGFIGFKAGMTHIQVIDNRAKSTTKGEKLNLPSTIIECPPMVVAGVTFYKSSIYGKRKIATFLAPKLTKELSKTITLPKKQAKNFEDVKDFVDLRILVHSNPSCVGSKKPHLLEIALGGSLEEKVNYAKENLGKELSLSDVFETGTLVDTRGITTGKGFQGTVKRFGVPIRQKKSEKTKRGIGNLGAWTPKRVDYRVPQPGKMGFHLRTEYNKLILSIGADGKSITPAHGLHKYGVVKNTYVLLKGSVQGPKKRTILLTKAIRPNKKKVMGVSEPVYVSVTA